MNDDNQLAAVRQQKILDLVNLRKSAKLAEIRDTFGISEATVRRDLSILEDKGKLTRTFGGAIANVPVSKISSNEKRAINNIDEKVLIAKEVIKLFKEEQTVFLDAGTTSVEVAKLITNDLNCSFVTNSFGVANILRNNKIDNLYVVGGAYLSMNDSFGGSIALAALRSLSFDIAILCVTAVDVERLQISIGNEAYSLVQREIIQVSRKNYVAADHTKFRPSAFVNTANLNELTGIVTTSKVPTKTLDKLKPANLEIYLG